MTTGRINQITIFMSYTHRKHIKTHTTHTQKVCPASFHMSTCDITCAAYAKSCSIEQDTTHAVLFSDGKPKVLMVFQCAPRALPPCVQVHTGETAPELSVANSQIVFLKDTTTKEDAPGINQTRSLGRASSVWGADVA